MGAAVVEVASCAAFADTPPDEMPVAFGADQLRLDARARALDASGHVHVDQPPFHFMSDELRLRRVPIGVELDGRGALVFCPCWGAPLALRFRGATVAPPHDVVLRDPVLEVFGLPIAWAPALWLRSAGRFGLLAPEVAWRGADGLFLGEGVHVPWRNGDVVRGLDLHAGAYVDGGVAVRVAMRTTMTQTQIAWDDWRGDHGVALGLSGATAIADGDGPDSTAWAVDALRGARAVKATTDLNAAAFPYDQAEAQSAWRGDGWTFASGLRTLTPRGGDLLDLGVGGPVVVARRADAIAHAGSYDAGVEGGAIGGGGLGTPSPCGRLATWPTTVPARTRAAQRRCASGAGGPWRGDSAPTTRTIHGYTRRSHAWRPPPSPRMRAMSWPACRGAARWHRRAKPGSLGPAGTMPSGAGGRAHPERPRFTPGQSGWPLASCPSCAPARPPAVGGLGSRETSPGWSPPSQMAGEGPWSRAHGLAPSRRCTPPPTSPSATE